MKDATQAPRRRTVRAKAARPIGFARTRFKKRHKATLEEILKLPGFGMWKDYPGTVEDYMRKVRKPRYGLG
jgi:hypothetical protein